MRKLIRAFVLLDLISLIIMAVQLWYVVEHFDKIMESFPSEKVQAILRFPVFMLVLFGAIGLFSYRRYGYLLYYIQFPFRLYLWVFSIGFVTGLPELFGVYDDVWIEALFKACFVAEFLRLFITVQAHRKLKA